MSYVFFKRIKQYIDVSEDLIHSEFCTNFDNWLVCDNRLHLEGKRLLNLLKDFD